MSDETLTIKRDEFQQLLDDLKVERAHNRRLLKALAEQKEKERGLRYQVQNFHEKFGYPHPSKPVSTIDPDLIRFRLRLMAEEFLETLEAALGKDTARPWTLIDTKNRLHDTINHVDVDVDLVELVDGLADLDYVVEGFRISLGVDGWPIAQEVHNANMRKTMESLQAADAAKSDGTKRRADGKLLKPEGWEPPDIKTRLIEQGWTPPGEST